MTTTTTAPARLLLADIELQNNCRMAVVEDEKLLELAASIREIGMLQPLLVEPCRGGFALVAGYRRHRAAEIAGVTTAPVSVIGADLDPLTANLVENLHRVDLSAVEKGRALVRMCEQGKTQRQVAAECGWSQGNVSKLISYVTFLHRDVQTALHEGRLTLDRANVMLRQPHEVQLRMLATGPGKKRAPGGRKPEALVALEMALRAFQRGEEDAALVSARQAVHELERRQRDGRTNTPRHAPAPTATRDQAERATLDRAARSTARTRENPIRNGSGLVGLPLSPPSSPLPVPVLAHPVEPLPPAGQRTNGIDHLDDDCPPGRPKVKCCDCKQWLSVPALSTSRKRLLAHREITACDVTSQLKALPK